MCFFPNQLFEDVKKRLRGEFEIDFENEMKRIEEIREYIEKNSNDERYFEIVDDYEQSLKDKFNSLKKIKELEKMLERINYKEGTNENEMWEKLNDLENKIVMLNSQSHVISPERDINENYSNIAERERRMVNKLEGAKDKMQIIKKGFQCLEDNSSDQNSNFNSSEKDHHEKYLSKVERKKILECKLERVKEKMEIIKKEFQCLEDSSSDNNELESRKVENRTRNNINVEKLDHGDSTDCARLNLTHKYIGGSLSSTHKYTGGPLSSRNLTKANRETIRKKEKIPMNFGDGRESVASLNTPPNRVRIDKMNTSRGEDARQADESKVSGGREIKLSPTSISSRQSFKNDMKSDRNRSVEQFAEYIGLKKNRESLPFTRSKITHSLVRKYNEMVKAEKPGAISEQLNSRVNIRARGCEPAKRPSKSNRAGVEFVDLNRSDISELSSTSISDKSYLIEKNEKKKSHGRKYME